MALLKMQKLLLRLQGTNNLTKNSEKLCAAGLLAKNEFAEHLRFRLLSMKIKIKAFHYLLLLNYGKFL